MRADENHPNANSHQALDVRWKILAILAIASFISYVLRTNLSFAAPEMMDDLGLDEVQWGWVLAGVHGGLRLVPVSRRHPG